ncbi:MAG: BrnA antitoxin family protein [Pigmentiphaga sp.]
MKRRNPKMVDSENPEWTDADFARAKTAAEVLSELFGQRTAETMLRPRGRPKSASPKTHLNVRLDAAVVEHFKAGGAGWQTRMNEALKRAIEAELA